jgi:hypothetical protein
MKQVPKGKVKGYTVVPVEIVCHKIKTLRQLDLLSRLKDRRTFQVHINRSAETTNVYRKIKLCVLKKEDEKAFSIYIAMPKFKRGPNFKFKITALTYR